MDTRKHTNHLLRPDTDMVAAFLADLDGGWPAFREAYRAVLEARYRGDPAAFAALAARARAADVYLGCNCPTKKQPDVMRCHTVLALKFMQARFDDITVRLPA